MVASKCDDGKKVTMQQPPLVVKTITYNEHTLSIFKKRCSLCHNKRTMPDKNWEDYKIAFKHRYHIKARTVILKNMPPSNNTKMTEDEREIIKQWVDQGGKEKSAE